MPRSIPGDGDLSEAQVVALRWLAGDKVKTRGNRSVCPTGTMMALERKRLIEWRPEPPHGWRLTDKGGFVVEQLRVREAS